ncbi:MAG: glycoside hydrolase family 3 C-terminal domain-containing protein [Lachnospiraceae bacterium]|nr:glycoside hydrolase family 3 C-terminal domain-containing protein [Lachnospiraceae bacterium]
MNRAEARECAQKLVNRMTLEEKASQLRYDAPAIPRLGIPEYNWWNEALHGVARAGTATMFPQAIGLAAAFDEDLMEEIGTCIAREGRAKYNAQSQRGDRDIYKGLTFWSPNVNIFRDPRWGRGHETYGEDPFLTSRLGVRFILGLQGRDGSDNGGYLRAAACAKHFAVHSGPEALRHSFDAKANPKDMEETYLPAFEACVKEADVEAVMGAYNRTNGEVCCASPSLQNILRAKWGFRGHFVSDCWAIRDFHENHKVTATPEESVKLALENGCDVNCGCTYQKILDAVKLGMIDEALITESCVRLFTTRYLLGLFDEQKTPYDAIPFTEVECEKNLELAHRAAREGIVLLKNNGVLPMDLTVLSAWKTPVIGVIGPNANSRTALIGNYHGTSSRYVTVLEGIQDYTEAWAKERGAEPARILYSEGCHLYKDNVENLSKPEMADRLAEARTVADYSDVVILVVGLDETLEGEEGDTGNAYSSGDKKDLHLPPFQEELLRSLLPMKKPVIVINLAGSAIDLSVPQEQADAVIQAFYPGARGGIDLAQILFGEVSPSGKLPVTFYRDTKDLPDFTDYSMKNRTYRYYNGTPLYPFGFGLTYGDCSVTGMVVQRITENGRDEAEKEAINYSNPAIRVIVSAENRGADTEDVLQIYIRGLDDPNAVPHPQLAGFRRLKLRRDECKDVILDLPEKAFTSVDENGVRKIRSTRFEVFAAFSQPDDCSAKLTGHSAVKRIVEW